MVPEISSDESATSPIFLRSENLVEKKKTFTHATEVVVDSSSLVLTVFYVQNLKENFRYL